MKPYTFPSDDQSPPMMGSKWLSIQTLVDVDELRRLFDFLEMPTIHLVGSVIHQEQREVTFQNFEKIFSSYIEALKTGSIPQENNYMKFFNACITHDLSTICIKKLPNEEAILRPCLPVIQMQAHRFRISDDDLKLRSMVFGKDSITWGIQFSYPQFFQRGLNNPIEKVALRYTDNRNSLMFHKLQRWIRQETVPVSFLFKENKIPSSIRLGKACFSWINKHPQLVSNHIKVINSPS